MYDETAGVMEPGSNLKTSRENRKMGERTKNKISTTAGHVTPQELRTELIRQMMDNRKLRRMIASFFVSI